jgi:alpha-L-rhamnosidase
LPGIIPTDSWGYEDWIGPVWDAAAFIIPMTLYDYYGDTRGMEIMWPVCKRYLEYLKTRENEDKTVTYGIGDWVYYNTQTPTDYTSSCYYWLDNEYMARFAQILGHDGSQYAAKADELRRLINTKWLDRSKALYANGSQAAQSVALYLGLVPQELQQTVADNLSKMIAANGNYLDCGMLGSKTILRVLSAFGHADQAYEISCKDGEPAWGNWIKRGYTSLPERWVLREDFRDSSLNHVFLGDIYAWFENAIAGINFDPKAPGFKNILITPHFMKGLDHASGHYNSQAGMVKSSWQRVGDQVRLNVTVPTNSTATVIAGGKTMHVGAGNHTFTF